MFNNADLLDIPTGHRTLSLGFIDDIAYGVQGESDKDNAKKLERLLTIAEKWREKHGARFETSKYVLIHFTRAWKRNTTAHIHIGDTTIKPANEAKYLGVIFDHKLSFRQHIQYAAKKGTKFGLAISRIAKCTWGAAYQQTRTLFTSVAAPRMDYAAIVWYKPPKDRPTPPHISTARLESAQRTAMKAILGTFRTTATSALQIETSLPPTHLRLRNRVLQSWARMQTAPETHPINAAIRRATCSQSKIIITPLEHLARTFPKYASPIETIKPHPLPPWWSPPFEIEIEGDKTFAQRLHKHDDSTWDPTKNITCTAQKPPRSNWPQTSHLPAHRHTRSASYTPIAKQQSKASTIPINNLDREYSSRRLTRSKPLSTHETWSPKLSGYQGTKTSMGMRKQTKRRRRQQSQKEKTPTS